MKKNVQIDSQLTRICPKCKKVIIHKSIKSCNSSKKQNSQCYECFYNNRRITKDEFIKRAIKVHGNKYIYDKVIITDNDTKVVITCKKHQDFVQSRYMHLEGRGCEKCAIELRGDRCRDTIEEFIEKARKKHGDRYDYSLVKQFKNEADRVEIICPVHGIFTQTIHDHKHGGCSKCGRLISSIKQKTSLKDFIKKCKNIHGEKYNYNKIIYTGNITKVCINCPIHGDFLVTPTNFIDKKSGCGKCASEKRKISQEDFIKRSIKKHGNKYDYTLSKCEGSYKKVQVVCKKHGIFSVFAGQHMLGSGCPSCYKKQEYILGEIIAKYFLNCKIEKQKKIMSPQHGRNRYFDFYLEYNSKKIIIEYDGKQHYEPIRFFYSMTKTKAQQKFIKQQETDRLDTVFCKENNIILVRVKYNNDKEKIIKNLYEKLSPIASDNQAVLQVL